MVGVLGGVNPQAILPTQEGLSLSKKKLPEFDYFQVLRGGHLTPAHMLSHMLFNRLSHRLSHMLSHMLFNRLSHRLSHTLSHMPFQVYE